MKTNWQTKKLGDVCDLQNGFAFKSKDYVSRSETLNFRMSNIRPGGFVDIYHNQKFLPDNYAVKYKDFLLKDGDLVIAMTDMATETKILGVPTIVQTEGKNLLLNQRVGKFFDIQDDKVYIPFLRYILSSKQVNDYYKSLGRGGMQINIGKQDILNVKIPLPPLSEQKRIVKVLDEAFDKIEKAKENAEMNLKNSKELYESYLYNIFVNPKKDWEEKKLKDVCEKITDGTHQTPTYFDSGIVFLSSRNVTSGKINWDNIKYIDKKQHFEMHKRVAPRINDILLAKNGTTGVAALVDRDTVFDIYVSLALLRAKEMILPSFLLYFVNSSVAKKQFNKRIKGSGVPNLHLEEIREVIVNFPKSIPEQKMIIKKLDSLSEQTKKLEEIYKKKLADLEELKKSVLNKAFTGEL